MRPTLMYDTPARPPVDPTVPEGRRYAFTYDPGGGKVARAPQPAPAPTVVQWQLVKVWWYREGDEENGSGI